MIKKHFTYLQPFQILKRLILEGRRSVAARRYACFYFFYFQSYAPFSIFPYIFSVILMQYYGKTENDRTIRSCIRVHIQKVKKKKFFQKIIFWRVMAPWFFRFFIYYISKTCIFNCSTRIFILHKFALFILLKCWEWNEVNVETIFFLIFFNLT